LLPDFDCKILKSCEHPEINRAFVDNEQVDAVCALVEKPTWTAQDRQTINAMLNALYT